MKDLIRCKLRSHTLHPLVCRQTRKVTWCHGRRLTVMLDPIRSSLSLSLLVGGISAPSIILVGARVSH